MFFHLEIDISGDSFSRSYTFPVRAFLRTANSKHPVQGSQGALNREASVCT